MHHLSNRQRPTPWGEAFRLAVLLAAFWCSVGLGRAGVASASASGLPDGRAYELVTPPDLGGSALSVLPIPALPPISRPWSPVSADGQSVVWTTYSPPPGIDASGFDNAFVSRRDASGWRSTFISPPGTSNGGGLNPLLVWSTSDLQRSLWVIPDSLLDPNDHDPLDVSVPHPNLQYVDLYRREADGSFSRVSQGSLAPAVGSELPTIRDISADGLKVLFADGRQIEPDAAPGQTLYERVGNRTIVVGKDEQGNTLDFANGQALSSDGNIVVFNSAQGDALYVRDVAAGHTTVVAPPGNSQAFPFEALSRDGKRVFFSTTTALTDDDDDTSLDLYEYDVPSGSLSRISAPTGSPAGPGPGNADACAPPASSCASSPVAISPDGSKAYFLSPERLDGSRGVDGGANLYENDEGDVRFVATLDPNDPVFGAYPLLRHVRFTPDGSKLLFESRAQLTGYDNAGRMEIYLHDPVAKSLVCVSCRPSGVPPTGDASLLDGDGTSGQPWFGTRPMYPANSDEHGDHIFFHSTDAILPRDTNGRYDVYEYTVSNASTALISSGTSPNDSSYLGNGVDGKDVFFLTTEALVPQDRTGSIYKVYDARVGGGLPFSRESPKCTGEGCRGPQAPDPDVVSSGTTQASGQSRSPASSPSKLTVSGPKAATGTSIRLTARVSGAGRVRATGSGVRTSSLKTSRAGSYHLTVKLSRAAVARLRRQHRLAVSVTVRFTPSAGVDRTVRVRLAFKVKSKKKGH